MLVAAFVALLGGCSTRAIIEQMPASVGESADMPARPVQAYDYPAVHDMPPARPDQPLTDEQQVRMEKELETARDKQEGRPAVATGKKGAPKAKPAPQPAGGDQTDGSGTKP